MNKPTIKLKNFIEASNNRKHWAMKIVNITAHTGHPHIHLERYCRKYWRLPSHRLRGVDWIELAAYFSQAATTNGDTLCDLDKQ